MSLAIQEDILARILTSEISRRLSFPVWNNTDYWEHYIEAMFYLIHVIETGGRINNILN